MKPQSARFLDKADKLLNEAETMLHVGLDEAAGRSAYLAGFHAAQALIFERQGRALKAHSGVQSEFHRLVKNDFRFDESLRTFLSRAYNLKAIADYETGPGSDIPRERVEEAVRNCRGFVAWVGGLVLASSDGNGP
jgi:uncharacterized protein (UPF0332 family)